jgi:quinol monooxygenase YgiN
MAQTVRTLAVLTARPGQVRAVHALLMGMIAPSRAEPGNLRYELWVDRAEPGRFVLDELYADEAALEAHHASPHFKKYRAQIPDLADRMALNLIPIALV